MLRIVGVLNTIRDSVTGTVLAFLGDVVQAEAGGPGAADGDRAEWWQHVGFGSRPSKPERGKASAETVVWPRSDHDVVLASRDLRGQELAGLLDDGETVVYAAGPDGTAQGRVLLKKDGSVSLFTTDTNAKGGKSVYFRVAPDGFSFVAPWGTLKFDATGLHVLHKSGASFDLGGIYGLPAPLDQLTSYAKLQAASIVNSASSQSFGVGPGKPVASAPDVVAALSSLQTQITAVMGAVAALVADPTHASPSTATAASAAASAVSVGASTVATTALTIPTSTQSA